MLVAGKKVLVALGGNAIKPAIGKGSYEEQMMNIAKACDSIVRLIEIGCKVAITHGNGPQIGDLLIQQEESAWKIPPQPIDVCGAMTQGQIGYMLQNIIQNKLKSLNLNISVVTIITRVLVDKNDPAFKNPCKPIGPFYDYETAMRYEKEKGYYIRKVLPTGDKPYRRVVPSPDPIAIVEGEIIKRLMDEGVITIASGGGGIPVVEENGKLIGVEAVIDKDLAGERMAEAIGANVFIIITDIDKVKLNFGKQNEKDIDVMTIEEAEQYLQEGHFLPGSMEPKVKSCIRFIRAGGEKAIITSLDKAMLAIEGKAGTLIVP